MTIKQTLQLSQLFTAGQAVINLNNALFAEWTGADELTVTFIGGVVKTFSGVSNLGESFNEATHSIDVSG